MQNLSHKNITSVIKVTKKLFHKDKIALIDGQVIDINEDIIKESTILKYLTSNNPPNGLTKFKNFFVDKYNYFLVMENGMIISIICK